MTNTLRIVLILSLILYFLIVFFLLKRGRLNLKYTLLWLLMGVIMAIFVAFPDLLAMVGHLVGIEDGMNALFTSLIGFIFCLLMALTSIVSRQNENIKRLIQTNGLLEERIRKLEADKDIEKNEKE